MKPDVKVCCIKSAEEASMAIDYGAQALGLVGPMPSGPGILSLDTIRDISRTIPTHINSFYLTSKTEFDAIAVEYEWVQTSHIQLTDYTSENTRLALRKNFPDLQIVQVVHVSENTWMDDIKSAENHTDLLLLDSGMPKAKKKQLGGTGQTHDWAISRKIVQKTSLPVYLAGGIHAGNVQEAVHTVKPFGIDLCSGLRSRDKLDPSKLKAFFDVLAGIA